MQLLRAGVATSVIAMRLGNDDVRSTQMYLHADFAIKERALARTAQASVSHRPVTAPQIHSQCSRRTVIMPTFGEPKCVPNMYRRLLTPVRAGILPESA